MGAEPCLINTVVAAEPQAGQVLCAAHTRHLSSSSFTFHTEREEGPGRPAAMVPSAGARQEVGPRRGGSVGRQGSTGQERFRLGSLDRPSAGFGC